MRDLIQNILYGFRLAVFRPVSLWDFCFGKWQATLLFLLLIALSVGVEYFSAGLGAQVDQYAISGFLLDLAITLAGFFLIAQFLDYENNGRYMVVALAAMIPVTLFSALAEAGFQSEFFSTFATSSGMFANLPQILLFVLTLTWLIAVLMRTMKVAFLTRWLKALSFSIAFVVFIITAAMLLTQQQQLFWLPNNVEEDATSSYNEINTEQVYYDQATLIEQATMALASGVSGVPDVFLVTFASYGAQEVFKKEVEFVRQKVEKRYQSQGRSLALLNHPATVETTPLANAPNLQSAISAVGDRMSAEEDVLMVYLTSHGSEQAELSANLWPVQPNPVNAIGLRQMLDRAEIKWRIIVVSACFSGSFIDALKEPNTLILTASSALNSSFGCSNDRELTYFAEAMFDHAWEQTDSILETFDIAKLWVTEKEKAESKTPSEPQIYVGENIKGYLERLESRDKNLG